MNAGRTDRGRHGVTVSITVLVLLLSSSSQAYETNGRRWASMPVPVWVNPSKAPDMGEGFAVMDAVLQATGTWAAVGCSYAEFEIVGTTTAEWAPDGQNTLYFIDHDWPFVEMAAGATTWLPTLPEEPMEVDLALNAEDFQWIPGGGDALQADIVDPASVITHELGHWLGLAHSADQFATMYQAYLPMGAQATLAGDDKAGLCSLYPNETDECQTDKECPEGQLCEVVEGFQVCAEQRDPIGSFCSKDLMNCEGLCVISFYECTTICAFLTLSYDEGYCAPLCDEGECPAGWTCTPLPDYGIEVCFLGETDPEPGPEAAETAADLESLPDIHPIIEQVFEPGMEVLPDIPPVTDGEVVQNDAGGPDVIAANGGGGCSPGPPVVSPGFLVLLMILGICGCCRSARQR